MRNAFTLIELMVVVVLIFSFAGVIFSMDYNFFRKSAIQDQAKNIQNSLRKAQAVAINNRGDSSAGIKFSETNYTLFEGESYLDRRSAIDTIFDFPVAISIAGAKEIVFQKTTGLPIFPGLIYHWKFNENTGNILYDSSYFSNQNNGEIFGTWSRIEGKQGSAIEFSGYAYAEIEHQQELSPNEEITISLWANILSINNSRIIEKGSPNSGTGYRLSFSEDGLIVFSLGNGASAETINNSYSQELLGEWTYITVTWDGQAIKQYINGELQPDTRLFDGIIGFSQDNCIIGQEFVGKMDDFRLYDYALSEKDIKANYLAEIDDIVISLKFGEDAKYIAINSEGKIEIAR